VVDKSSTEAEKPHAKLEVAVRNLLIEVGVIKLGRELSGNELRAVVPVLVARKHHCCRDDDQLNDNDVADIAIGRVVSRIVRMHGNTIRRDGMRWNEDL